MALESQPHWLSYEREDSMGKLLRLVALTLAVAPCLGACGGPDDGTGSAAPSETAPAADASTTDVAATGEAKPPAAVPVPVNGGKTATDLGIETKGGIFTPLIDRGTALPATHSEIFTTAEDNQPTIEVDVFHGTSDRVADAQHVGRYELRVPKPQPKGVPQISVTFRIDGSGAFLLTATDSASGASVTVSKTG
jgi:molecular chaperone DnaK (HSP70)